MLNIIGPDVTAAGTASAGVRPSSGLQGIFAQLLASSGAPVAAAPATPVALSEVEFPGDATTQRTARERLGAALDGVVDWAVATGAPVVAGGSTVFQPSTVGEAAVADGAALAEFASVASPVVGLAGENGAGVAVGGVDGDASGVHIGEVPALAAEPLQAVPTAGPTPNAPTTAQVSPVPVRDAAAAPQAGIAPAAGTQEVGAVRPEGQPMSAPSPGMPTVPAANGAPLYASSPAPLVVGVNGAFIPEGLQVESPVKGSAEAVPQPSGGGAFTTQLADRLAVVLQSFDAANGTETRAVLAANAAGQTALTLMPGTPEDQAKAVVAAMRGLLGLDPVQRPEGAALVPSAPVLARVPGAVSLADLVARITAPVGVTEGLIPEGRAVEALRMPVAPARRMAAAGGLQGLLAQQLNGLAMTGDTARVRLMPIGLGEVRITVTATGTATVQADNPRVLSALRAMPGQITAILEQAGVPVRGGAIAFGAMARGAVAGREAVASTPGVDGPVAGAMQASAVRTVADPSAGRVSSDPTPMPRVEAVPATPEARLVADPLPLRPVEAGFAPSASRPQGHLAAHVTSQLKGQRVAEGTTRIALSPQGLGSLEIELARDDSGALRVLVRAENPAVLGALRDNREGLLGVLRDSGHGVQDSGLGFEEFGREGRPQQRAEPGTTGYVEAEEDEPDAAMIPVALADGRIDIFT